MPSPFTVRAVALLAVSSSIACGGTVVFEEPGEGGGGGSPSGSGASTPDSVAVSGNGGASSTDVAISASAVTSGPGGGDGGAPSGPVGPGPGGGSDTTGGGAHPGPGGVGGADVGNAQGGAVTSGAGGCGVAQESTNQYCYAAETCPDYRLELECEVNGDGPWTCWCYQDGQYQGSCTEGDFPSCSLDGCCESYWVLPG